MKIKVSWTEVKTSVIERETILNTDDYDNLQDLSFEDIEKTIKEDLLFVGDDNIEEYMKDKDTKVDSSKTVVYSKMRVRRLK
jgi:hypothetical protein